jgi:hypothetical protein
VQFDEEGLHWNAQMLCGTQDMRDGNAIAKEIAARLQLKLPLDLHAELFDPYVVPFARSKHEAMWSKPDSSLITIVVSCVICSQLIVLLVLFRHYCHGALRRVKPQPAS